MTHIKIKPLSVNKAWKGRRFKTKAYLDYELEITPLLPSNIAIPEGKIKFSAIYGMSNAGSDIDNPIKPFLDILQKKYDFNDNRIYELSIKKEKVSKGDEYINFDLVGVD